MLGCDVDVSTAQGCGRAASGQSPKLVQAVPTVGQRIVRLQPETRPYGQPETVAGACGEPSNQLFYGAFLRSSLMSVQQPEKRLNDNYLIVRQLGA
jgi:hypothetical protein